MSAIGPAEASGSCRAAAEQPANPAGAGSTHTSGPSQASNGSLAVTGPQWRRFVSHTSVGVDAEQDVRFATSEHPGCVLCPAAVTDVTAPRLTQGYGNMFAERLFRGRGQGR